MLKKSFTLCANKRLKKQSVNLKLNSPNKLVTTTIMNPSLNYLGYSKNKINNTNKTLPVKGIKNFVFPPLAKTKIVIKSYSTYAAPIASRYIKKTNVRYLSQKAIKPTVINSSIRKVLSVSCGTKITIPAIQNNNLSIIRSEKKVLSGGPNLVITRSDSQKWLENSYNRHGINKLDPNIKKLRKSVQSIKKSKSNLLYLFTSNNNQIILTELRKGYNKYTDSKNIAELTKLPFNKKVPGIFKRGNKAVKVFTPKLYSINKIRY